MIIQGSIGNHVLPYGGRGGARQGRVRTVRCSAFQQTATVVSNILSPASVLDDGCSTSARTHERTLLHGKEGSETQRQQACNAGKQRATEGPAIYVALDKAVLFGSSGGSAFEALRSGLLELTAVGVTGVVVDVHWSVVEDNTPGLYDWGQYRRLLGLVNDVGLKIKVEFCFHASRQSGVRLPTWVQEAMQQDPNLMFSDRSGSRVAECLTLGVDDVPALAGRSAIQSYQDVMLSFSREFSSLLDDGTITSYSIGAGPEGELRYPSHPSVEPRYSFHGVGEFQCYDRHLMSSLMACAHRVGQPSWGLAGPHDAGNYGVCPHQCNFFNHRSGSWESQYGRFFLQWYSSKLVQHADRLLSAAAAAFGKSGTAGCPRAELRVPAMHWWYGSASHAAELSAGYYNAGDRDGYLPLFQLMARRGAGVQLVGGEARASEQLAAVLSRPEALLTQQRVAASAVHLPVVLRNATPRFDEAALQRLEASLGDRSTSQGIQILPADSLLFASLGPAMLEAGAWQRFRALVRRIRQEPEGGSGMAADGRPSLQGQRYNSIAMA